MAKNGTTSQRSGTGNTSASPSGEKEAFLALLQGNLSVFSTAKKFVPKSKLCVFVSSTFTDTRVERDILMEDILPKLQDEGRKHGVMVTLADMRFGIKDESTNEHDTWIECAKQLLYCYEESDGLFFLSLQADKYGYMPLPKYLTQSSVDPVAAGWKLELQKLFSEWYTLDENFTTKQYVLKSLSETNKKIYWEKAFPELRTGLVGLTFSENSFDRLVIGTSVTEWEVSYALALAGAQERSKWFRREFKDDISVDEVADRKVLENFCDFASGLKEADSIGAKHRALLSKMQSCFHKSRIIKTKAPIFAEFQHSDKPPNNQNFEAYKQTITPLLESLLKEEIDSVSAKTANWGADGNGLKVSGEDLNEMFHHCKIAVDKCSTFLGRETLLNQAFDIIKTNSIQSKTMDICLSIIGSSGSGKTALMAKLAELVKKQSPDVPVIIRFCGTSSGSVDGLNLLKSICRQIQLCHNLDIKVLSNEYNSVVGYFHQLILDHPVILFIDSLDQLTDAYFARSKLTFLSGLKCHSKSRVIVSALPDEKEAGSDLWKYIYLCDTRLLEANVKRITLTGFGENPTEAAHILRELLKIRGRTLNPDQFNFVSEQTKAEPTALYLNLAVLVVSKWTSSMPASSMILEPKVRGLTNQVFDNLEIIFGKSLTRSTIGFLTYAKAGVSDLELQDLLSLCEDVLTEVFQYWKPSKYRRIPLGVILRLRESLRGLVVERSGGCWSWYHRQLRETAESRYKSVEGRNIISKQILRFHELMGLYFVNSVDKDIVDERLIRAQNLTFDMSRVWLIPETEASTKINQRRCVEGLYHLARAGNSQNVLDSAVIEACSFDVICANILIGQGFSFVENINELDKVALASGYKSDKLSHFARWLRQDMNMLSGRFKSASYWVVASAMAQPLKSEVRNEISNLLKNGSTQKSFNQPTLTLSNLKSHWIRGSSMGGQQEFDDLLSTFLGHTGMVMAVRLSADGSRIVSASADKSARIWDSLSGACLFTLEGHTADVTSVCFYADDSRVVSGSKDKTVKIWDAYSGLCLSTLNGHTDWVMSVCVNANKSQVISGSVDKSVKVWDIKNGKCVATLKEHSEDVTTVTVCMSKDCSRIISGSRDKSLKIWDAGNYECLMTLRGHTGYVMSVCMSSDGIYVVSGSEDCTVKVWDPMTGDCLSTLQGHTSWVLSVCIIENSSQIVSSSADKTLKVWDLSKQFCVKTLEGHASEVMSVCVNAKATKIVSGSTDKTIKVWSTASKMVSSIPKGHSGAILCICSNDDGSLVVSGSSDSTIKVWDAKSGKCEATLEGHGGQVTSVHWISSKSQIVSGSSDKTIKIWDKTQEYKCITTLEGHKDGIVSVSATADGSQIISGSLDKKIKIWSTSSNTCTSTLDLYTGTVASVFVSSDGQFFALGSYNMKIKLWNVMSGDVSCTLKEQAGDVTSIRLSADGSRIVSASRDLGLKVWNTKVNPPEESSSVLTLDTNKHLSEILAVRFSKDGSRIISSSKDGTVKVWDASTGDCLASLEGHSSDVTAICITEDGTFIFSGSEDGTVKMWDVVECK